MSNENCVFCKIVNNELPATKVWENEKYLAILNLFPNTKGVTIILSKQHLPSDVFDNEDATLNEAVLAAKLVANKMRNGLKADRICLVGEGLAVDHFHLKLFPVYNLQKFLEESKGIPEETEYNNEYRGYLTTKSGPMAQREELEELGELIRRGYGST